MSRVTRASTAAVFTYVQTALAIAVGLAIVPLILSRIDAASYGLWLASGEVLAYATMAELGVLTTLPWLVAEADGRGDRDGVRTLLANAVCATLLVAAVYLVSVALFWFVVPSFLSLTDAQRAAVSGPLGLMACVTGIVLPLRVAQAVLTGLQDVRFAGALSTVGWFADVTITLGLLLQGFGLYALAAGASTRALLIAIASIVRLCVLCPDLLTKWPRPTRAASVRLFREGFGGWLGGWGWRLSAASDAIILTSLGQAAGVTRLMMTSKLPHMLMQLAWVPGDSGLVGLAQLSTEASRDRVRAAVTALFRLHLTLASAAACVVLLANAPFVTWWLPSGIFGGRALTVAVACTLVVMTGAHALCTVVSVLGLRLTVGLVTLAGGLLHIALAYVLVQQVGLVGVPLAAVVAQCCLVYPLLLKPVARTAGLSAARLMRDVVAPWGSRSLPALGVCAVVGALSSAISVWTAGALACAAALGYLWITRDLLLDYPPVAAIVHRSLVRLRLQARIASVQ